MIRALSLKLARRELRLVWLLWLALLLPLAQLAAAWHGYAHVARLTQAKVADGSSISLHCDLCLAAAAVSGGALARSAAPLLRPSARPGRPLLPSAAGLSAPARLGYQSRAPPTSRR